MDEIFIDIRYREWLQKFFKDKDFVSIDDLLGVIEDLDCEVERLNEKIANMRQDVQDFYTPKTPYEIFGISEKDFH